MKYMLITAAYNEEQYLLKTIESVLLQSVMPDKWIIISDCSSDGTDDIIKSFSRDNDFIQYIRRTDKEKKGHNFASKVHALNLALSHVHKDSFEYIGVLDADIILPDDYYEHLMERMINDNKLGVAGGMIFEYHNGKKVLHDISLNTVIGSVQFFRMNCFREIGDFLPMRYGGEDSMACVIANYHGWTTRTYKDIEACEQKYIGRAKSSLFKARIDRGKSFYDMGYHPFFFLIKCIFRMKDRPYIWGSFGEFYGYLYLAIRKTKRTPSAIYIDFLRKSQMKRLLHFELLR